MSPAPSQVHPGGVAEPSKMRSIEGARALAAVSVVLMHAANLMRVEQFSGHIGLGGLFDFGYVGVDFFFALSGFIITYVHFGDIGRLERIPRYLWRRFSRIYPIYWFVLLLSIAVSLLGRLASGKGATLEMGLEDIAGTIFLVMGEGEPKYVGVAWSLQYEIIFYTVFCILLVHARLGAAVFSAWALYIVAHALGWVGALPLQLANPHCLQFLFGVAVGVLARRHPLKASKGALVAVILFAVAGVVFEVYGPYGKHSAIGRVVLGLASAAILATLVALENRRALVTPQWLYRMGSVSYSIYLGHIVFINLTFWMLARFGLYHALPEALVFTLAVAVALAATFVIGRVVELPLVGLLKDRCFGAAGEAPAGQGAR